MDGVCWASRTLSLASSIRFPIAPVILLAGAEINSPTLVSTTGNLVVVAFVKADPSPDKTGGRAPASAPPSTKNDNLFDSLLAASSDPESPTLYYL